MMKILSPLLSFSFLFAKFDEHLIQMERFFGIKYTHFDEFSKWDRKRRQETICHDQSISVFLISRNNLHSKEKQIESSREKKRVEKKTEIFALRINEYYIMETSVRCAHIKSSRCAVVAVALYSLYICIYIQYERKKKFTQPCYTSFILTH